MNTDFIVWDEVIRDKDYQKNITSKGDTRYYDDSCNTIKEYAREQNTVYDPMTNQILYGINSNMHVLGVSDGTCDQINPYIFQPANICGAGAAGGNRCVPDAYPQAYSIEPNIPQDILLSNKINGIENFDANNYYCDSCNITQFVVLLLLIVLLIGTLYAKSFNKDI